MKRTVWKFPIDAGLNNTEGKVEIDMPEGDTWARSTTPGTGRS